jgi:VanZ family protein
MTVTLGLWPFHAPVNDFEWLHGRSGVKFGNTSTAFSAGTLYAPDSAEEQGISTEIWLRPANIWEGGTLIAFWSPQEPFRMRLHQSNAGIDVSTKGKGPRSETNTFRVDDVFSNRAAVFITIASGREGTEVYRNAVPIKRSSTFRLSSTQLAGRLVIGDSSGQSDNWKGELFGLAIYHRELTRAEIAEHYQTWSLNGRPNISAGQSNVALYLVDEHERNTLHDSSSTGLDLQFPKNYTVLGKIALEPAWDEFSPSRSYWAGVIKNIVGFMPLGFCVYVYAVRLKFNRPRLATVLLGTLTSLAIEVLQAHLPTRDSGTTDIITNMLGTWMGSGVYSLAGRRLIRVVRQSALSVLQGSPGSA